MQWLKQSAGWKQKKEVDLDEVHWRWKRTAALLVSGLSDREVARTVDREATGLPWRKQDER